MNENFSKVAKVLAEYKEIDAAEINMETTFEELGFDSLDAVELVVLVEKHYGVAINDPDLAKTVFKNLDVLSDHILNNLPAK